MTEQTLSFTQEVRATRETMATLAASTATEPPARLRSRLLKIVARDAQRASGATNINRWRAPLVAVAAATAIGLAAAGIGTILRPPPPTVQRVFSASDVRTVSGAIPTGGTATVVYSRQQNTAVLVMNNVAPPQPRTVYQMWLIDDRGPKSAGTMDAQAAAPSTTAAIPRLDDSTSLASPSRAGGVLPHRPARSSHNYHLSSSQRPQVSSNIRGLQAWNAPIPSTVIATSNRPNGAYQLPLTSCSTPNSKGPTHATAYPTP